MKKKETYITLVKLKHKKADLFWAGEFMCGIDLIEARSLMNLLRNYIRNPHKELLSQEQKGEK